MLNKSSIALFVVIIILTSCQSTTVTVDSSEVSEQKEISSPVSETPEVRAEDTAEPGDLETAKSTPVIESVIETEEVKETGTMESGTADADVEFVRAVLSADGTWSFSVTVRHPDTGWEDYTNGWDVLTPDGTVLKVKENDPFTRLLLHPHENEQPFTRSQSGITIPDGITMVLVRAHDLVDGYGGKEVNVDLSTASGPGYEVERQ